MKIDKFTQPRFYLRRDPDAGWTLAMWRWRVFFQVVGRVPRRRPDAEIDELRRVYNDTYCHWRREGVSGGEAERHAMRVLLAYLDGVATDQPTKGSADEQA